MSEAHLREILREWVTHYNGGRAHSTLGPGVPDPPKPTVPLPKTTSRHRLAAGALVRVRSVLGACITSTHSRLRDSSPRAKPRNLDGVDLLRRTPGLLSSRWQDRLQNSPPMASGPAIIDQWTTRFAGGLNALQLRAVNEYGVLAGRSLLVVAPTSSGKTMIGELAAMQAITAGKKAAFLLPYKALVNEKFDEFTARYAATGLRVVRCSGDASDGIVPS